MTAHLPTGCPASLPAKAKLRALVERLQHLEEEIRMMEDRHYLIEHEIAECQAAMGERR